MKDLQLTPAHITHSNLIESIDDPEADALSIEAWAYLIEQKKLTHDVIKKVQGMITEYQRDELAPHERGWYRDMARLNVYVGDHTAPAWHLVRPMLDNWLLDYKNMTPKKAHIRFEYIHPFVDGNGRTGRMLMWWHERQLGQPPTFIDVKDRETYYGWFKKKGK